MGLVSYQSRMVLSRALWSLSTVSFAISGYAWIIYAAKKSHWPGKTKAMQRARSKYGLKKYMGWLIIMVTYSLVTKYLRAIVQGIKNL